LITFSNFETINIAIRIKGINSPGLIVIETFIHRAKHTAKKIEDLTLTQDFALLPYF
jgi:hypothetical protein